MPNMELIQFVSYTVPILMLVLNMLIAMTLIVIMVALMRIATNTSKSKKQQTTIINNAPNPQPYAQCPHCKSRMRLNGNIYTCENPNCNFSIFKHLI